MHVIYLSVDIGGQNVFSNFCIFDNAITVCFRDISALQVLQGKEITSYIEEWLSYSFLFCHDVGA